MSILETYCSAVWDTGFRNELVINNAILLRESNESNYTFKYIINKYIINS